MHVYTIHSFPFNSLSLSLFLLFPFRVYHISYRTSLFFLSTQTTNINTAGFFFVLFIVICSFAFVWHKVRCSNTHNPSQVALFFSCICIPHTHLHRLVPDMIFSYFQFGCTCGKKNRTHSQNLTLIDFIPYCVVGQCSLIYRAIFLLFFWSVS